MTACEIMHNPKNEGMVIQTLLNHTCISSILSNEVPMQAVIIRENFYIYPWTWLCIPLLRFHLKWYYVRHENRANFVEIM